MFICYPQINLRGALGSFAHMHRVVRILHHLMFMSPAEVKQDKTSPCFKSQNENKYPFRIYLMPWLPHICVFFCWWFCCSQWPPSIVLKCSLEVLKSMIKLPKKIYVLHKLHFGRSYIAFAVSLMNQQYLLNKVSLNKS